MRILERASGRLLMGGVSEIDRLVHKYDARGEEDFSHEDWFRVIEHRWLGGGREAAAAAVAATLAEQAAPDDDVDAAFDDD